MFFLTHHVVRGELSCQLILEIGLCSGSGICIVVRLDDPVTVNYVIFIIYVAAKATYIRLLHGKVGIFFWGGGFGPSSVHRGRTHIVLGCNM